MNDPRLSLILCSRNDAYMGNSRWRLETTLNYAGERVAALGRGSDIEILVTDWGSDVPLRDVVRLVPAARAIVSFVTVPPALARAGQRDSPFSDALALNVAARRSRGLYFGRIDQDTLVGERFLRWFVDVVEQRRSLEVTPREALFFASRRDIPYCLASRSPSLGNLTTFVRLLGTTLPVLREVPEAGHPFWTGSVGIWLAHRDLWDECGGYDERLIYYNWMETDMICRLRQKYTVVDAGEPTGYDFYHLEHVDPRSTHVTRRHAMKNAAVDLNAPPTTVHPNQETWGLASHALPLEPGTGAAPIDTPETFTFLLLRLAGDLLVDQVVVFWNIRRHVWGGRYQRARGHLSGQPVWRWPAALWRLWSSRSEARIRRTTGVGWIRARRVLTATMRGLGLLGPARRWRVRVALALSGEVRRAAREDHERFVQFDREYGACVAQNLTSHGRPVKTGLVVSSRCPTIEGELCTIKALQLAGFTPVVLLEDERKGLRPFYERTGASVHNWSEFISSSDYSSAAAAIVSDCRSIDDLMAFTHGGVRVGMHAVCTALRRSRLGVIDLRTRGVRALLARFVAASMAAEEEAERMLEAIGPDLVLSDHEYTPKGEFFDSCLASGRQVITCTTAHRSDALIFKRYARENRDDHVTALSSSSWAHAREIEWTHERRQRLAGEVTASYVMGDWFLTPWLQSNGHRLEPAEVRRGLGIDAMKKTAFIFPHVLWDAPVMWGRPLFPSYQEWLIETVATACRNTDVNWVIKVHPDHVWKHEEYGYGGEATEIRVMREQVGQLPPHIRVIPPETSLSTLSLFPVMDYCVTVRGTVGVEAAMRGIPVLTAGAARYSGRGFTIDSASRSEYLAKLARIHEMPRLSDREHELAERFAYALFLMRPLTLTSVTWDRSETPGVGSTARRRARINARTEDDWRRAADLTALAEWFVSGDEDFLGRAD